MFFLLIIILSISCAKKIDSSSDEAFQKSLDDIKSTLKGDKVAEFEEAILLITMSEINFQDIMSGKKDGDDLKRDAKSKLNGLTSQGVFDMAAKMKLKIEEKKKEEAKKEILELREQQKQALSDIEKLKKFKVNRSRFYKRNRSYGGAEPIIELTVKNETKYAISRAYFEGTLSSEGRTIPWLKEEFNYSISGGLEPGEEATWYLAPNMFSEWGEVNAPKNAILVTTVTGLDGPDEEQLFSIDKFNEDDKERLEELLKSYPEFK